MIELIPRASSGIEVSIPKTKKEMENEEIFIRFDMCSTEDRIRPVLNHKIINETTK